MVEDFVSENIWSMSYKIQTNKLYNEYLSTAKRDILNREQTACYKPD